LGGAGIDALFVDEEDVLGSPMGLLMPLLAERRKMLKDLLPACAVAAGRAALPAGAIYTQPEPGPEARRVRSVMLSWRSLSAPPETVTTGGVAEEAACISRRPLLRPAKAVADFRRCTRLVADDFFFSLGEPGSEVDEDEDDAGRLWSSTAERK
jgi:hypothetical protein